MAAVVVVAAAAALAWSAMQTSAATSVNFSAGSLIIPMDTDTSGNHPSYNQNTGMWKAYGLLYRLLANGIPVRWAISQTKTSTSDVDFTVTNVKDKRTGTALGSWDYRGGPFVVESQYAAQALPIIQAFWAAQGNQPNVHEAQVAFTADVRVTLQSAPRIADEAINGGIGFAYYNAAGIPDSNGNIWTSASPNVLDETEIANGGLYTTSTTCPQRKYDIFVTPHNGGYGYSLTDPTDLGTRAYAQLDTFVHDGGGWTALCHSILSNENNINNLTRNGSPAVKNLFFASRPGGIPGGFLTTNGFSTIANGGGTWSVIPSSANLPVIQSVPTSGTAQALPGGSVQTWPSPGNAGAPTYYADTESIAKFDNPGVDYDHIIAGTYHNSTGAGKVTFIGGHSFSTAVPYSTNAEAPYLRAFFNSLFFNGSAVAKLDMKLSPASFPQNGTGLLSASVVNVGASKATGLGSATLTMQPGFTYVSTTTGPAPTSVTGNPATTGQTLTWSSLGDIDGGQTAVTVQVSVDSSITASLGNKQFGQFHILYGDEFGEGFTADLCRDVTIVPQPAPKLTKTPASQGPVSTGQTVSWTLAYGNTGAAALNGGLVQDTLPSGFAYVSSSSSPAITPTVIPGSQTILRWNVGAIPAGTSSAGTITVTARAGAVTSPTGTPPQQTFTNNALLRGTDAGGTQYTQSATADVIVQAPALSLGKTVDKSVTTLPDATGVTYTLTPGTSDNGQLSSVRVFDTVPTGATAPPAAVGQGGTYGAYTPLAADPGNDPGPPVLDTSLAVSTNVLQQPNSVTVTLNVKISGAGATDQANVAPGSLDVAGGAATCTGPAPATQTVLAGAVGANFVWTCSLDDLAEYTFSTDASNGTVDWPAATSASVLSVETAGSNVITWSLGSNAAAVPGETVTSGYTSGVYGLQGNNLTTFDKYNAAANAWTTRTAIPTAVKAGASLAADPANGQIYALRGNNQKNFYRYDALTNAWTALANTAVSVNTGGGAVFLGGNVYAAMGNSTSFARWSPGGPTGSWTAMTAGPKFLAGGALATDGTNVYGLVGNKTNAFWRYNVGADTWTQMANTPATVNAGGALVYVSPYLYAFRGNNTNTFWRYDIGANAWTTRANAPGNVQVGGALTTDGTSIYAFQGKTTGFWRYSPGTNAWASPAPTVFPAVTNTGAALAYLPAVSPAGRYSDPDVSTSIATPGTQVTVTMSFSADNPQTNVVPSALTTTPVGGASCSTLTGPTLASADNNISGINDPVDYTWTCTVAAGANAGESLKFAASATANGPVAFPAATSASVLVTPLLTFRVALPGGAPAIVKNTGIIVGSGTSAVSQTATTATGSPVLTISKANSPASGTTLVPGDPITYTMVVENSGAGNATSVTATDSVPANTTYVTCTGGVSCNQAAGTVTWNLGTLAPGATSTISYTVATSSTPAVSDTDYTISNTAQVSSTQTAPVSSNTVTNTLRVKPTIVKAVSETEGQTSDVLTYTLQVSNPGAAFTADLSDTIPAGVSFTGVGSCAPACTLSGGAVRWNGAAIAAGTNTFSFTATITAGGGTTITNSSTLDATAPNLAPLTSNTVQTEVGPMLDLIKFVNPVGQVNAGDTLTYTLELINGSNVAATGVVVTDPLPAYTNYVNASCTTPQGACSLVSGVVTWTYGNLAPGSVVNLTFQVTVGTLPGGVFQVFNVGTVTATNMSGSEDSNPVGNPTPTPTFSLSKSASPSTYSAVGNVVNYTYVVSNNSSTVTVNGPVTVTDDKTTVSCPAGDIAPLATKTCTATYSVTQADLDAGSVTNTATAHAGATNSNNAQATVTAVQSPSLAVVKSSTTASVTTAGQVVPYTFTVTNTGNVTLTGITVSDPKCGAAPTLSSGDTNADTKLQRTETWVYTCNQTVTQAEMDAGGNLSNTVTVDSAESAPATSTKNIPVVQSPSIAVVKSSTTVSVTAAGQVVPYTFTVTNTGNVTLTGVTVADPKCDAPPAYSVGDGNGDSRLQLAETWVYGCSHTVTQAEMDAGGNLSNTVTADSMESAPATSTLNIPVTQSAAIQVVKSSTTASVNAPGQVVPYTLTVTNTGNVTLTGITVSDPKCNAAPVLSAGDANADSKLQLGETWVYGCTHTVTVAEMDAGGSLSNTVTADSVESAPATSTLNIPVTQSPAIGLVKVAVLDGTVVAPPGSGDAGDRIDYTLTSTNTGNVTLTGVTITDPMFGALACVPAQPAALAPGAALTCTASHTITVGDVTTGHVDNTAQTSGTDPNATTVSDTASVTEALSPAPSLAIVKSALPTTYDHVGQVIAYSYQVTNDGNTTLFGPLSVTDDVTTNESCPVTGGLAPGASITCTSSYAITQADLDAGSVTNIAFASNASVSSPTDTVTVTAIQSPQLALAKNGVLVTNVVAPAGRVDAGDRVDYTLSASNMGNVTLHGVTIADAKLGALTCVQPVTLAPGASLACTGSWTITQADIDAGQVGNTGTADSVETPPVSTPHTAVLAQVKSLSLVKTVQQVGFTTAGDPLDYRYRVTNTGNTSLAGPVSVIDDKTGVACPSVTTVGDNDAALDPGEALDCTATYAVTAADVTAGLVTNTAQASAAGTLSNVDSVTVTKLSAVADLAVTKTSAPNPYAAGSPLTWTVRVTNNGPSPVVGATVADTVPAALAGVTWTCAVTTGSGSCASAGGAGNAISTTVDLANGAVATYTITGTVNPATVGTLANTAIATTPLGVLDPKPGNNVATDANAAVPAVADAAIAIAPGASLVSPSAALSFDVTVSNNGSAAADGVKALVSIPPGYGFVSATGGGWTCSLSVNLVVCQLAGQLASGATAPPVALALVGPAGVGHTTLNASVTTTTTDPNPTNDDASAGVDVTAPPIVPPGGPQADLALAKSASPTSASTGDRITYTVTTANNGPDAASNVVVTDTLPAGVSFVSAAGAGWSCARAGNVVTCSTPTLASGAAAPLQVVVTAAAPGTQVNAASVGSATADPNLANNTATASTSVSARADLAVTKTASGKTFVIGQPLVFTVTVANNGPDAVTGARVQDAVPANLGSVSWTCAAVSGACAASGTGAVDHLVDVAAGGRVVFTVKGTPAAGSPTTIANTASVTLPAGVTDPDTANNTATVSVKRTVGPTVLRVQITPKVATLTSGVPVQATVTTTNVGVEAANGVITCVSLPPGITVAQPAGGFPRSNAYCWTKKQLAPKGKVRYRLKLRGDRQLATRVRLVAVAQAGNAPRVNDKSRLVVKKGRINGVWVFTG